MRGLNPNFVLLSIVAVALAAIGAILFVLGGHGSVQDQVVQVGLLTAVAVPVITSLFALLMASRAEQSINGVHQSLYDQGERQDQVAEELEAKESRIAALEERLRRRAGPL